MNKPYWKESADGMLLVQQSTPEESGKWSVQKAVLFSVGVSLVLWGLIIYGVAWVLQ